MFSFSFDNMFAKRLVATTVGLTKGGRQLLVKRSSQCAQRWGARALPWPNSSCRVSKRITYRGCQLIISTDAPARFAAVVDAPCNPAAWRPTGCAVAVEAGRSAEVDASVLS